MVNVVNINKINIYIIIIFLNVNIYGQTLLKYNDDKSDKCFFENNGYRIELNELGYKIIKDNEIVVNKNISGVKSVKTSQDNNFTILSNFEKNENKLFRINTITLYDKNYDQVQTFVDTVYNDYYANLYAVNNSGDIICYDINNNLITLKRRYELNNIELPFYFSVKTEAQHFLNVDNQNIFLIKNITNPLDDEILPGFTILYKINMSDFQIISLKISLNVVTSYYLNSDYLVVSGNNGSEYKTYLFDKKLKLVNEIDERFNLIFNINEYFISLNNSQIAVYDSLLKATNFKKQTKTFNIVDYFILNGKYYLAEYVLNNYKIYLIDLTDSEIKLVYQTEFESDFPLVILKLKTIYLLDKNRTIFLE